MFSNKKKDSVSDFEQQFKYHSKIDDYWGSLEMLKDIVNPFDLSLVKTQNYLRNRRWLRKNFKKFN